jgi:acyl-CoA reductase-like NAD-dependent aldehyde dehydrogenase
VHESIADDFISILQQETKEIRAGYQVDDKHQLRGLYDQASAKRIADVVDDGIARGAKLVVGNHDIQQNIEGSVVQPIVLDHVVQGMRMSFPLATCQKLTNEIGILITVGVADEEIFGPVLGITRFRTDEEAIQIANSSQYGLASAIHSRDISRALKIAQKLDAAGVHINSFTLRTHAVSLDSRILVVLSSCMMVLVFRIILTVDPRLVDLGGSMV